MVRVAIEPPAIHRASPLQGLIDDFKAAKLRGDTALLDQGRIVSQLREQTPMGWGEFCKTELGISKQWANKLIDFFKGTETPGEYREAQNDRRRVPVESRLSGPSEADLALRDSDRLDVKPQRFTSVRELTSTFRAILTQCQMPSEDVEHAFKLALKTWRVNNE